MAGANKNNAMALIEEIDERDGADYGDANSTVDDIDSDADDDASSTGGDADNSGAADDALTQEASRQTQRVKADEAKKNGAADPAKKKEGVADEQARGLQKLPNGLLQDAHGNLVHPNGSIIAKHGSERRLFEQNQRLRAQFEQVTPKLAALEKELQETRQASTYHTKFGLTNEDMAVGVPLIAEFAKDPVNAARKVLQMVVGMGHSLDTILDQKGIQAIETQAISRMLDERLAPLQGLVDQRKTVETEQQVAQRAEQAVQQFFNDHEHAMMHAHVIDQLIGRRAADDPSYTPEKAYRDLELWAAKNGLDFSKPLQPQIQAKQQGAQTQEDPTAVQGARRNGSLPNGRGAGASRHVNDTETVEANTSWEDIIRRSMRTMTN